MVPFITEHVWQSLITVGESDVVESVHLSSFPESDDTKIDEKLSSSVALSRRLVELGRAARAESKIKIRQPLARALIAANRWVDMDPEIREHIQDELNVAKLDLLSDESEGLVSISIKANFRSIGSRYGADVQAIAAAITHADAASLVKELRKAGEYTISYGEKSALITPDDLVITETPKEGWSVASHSGESVALDLTLTPELIQAGLMREVIRTIQEQRKSSGFEISDRIHVRWKGGADLAAAISAYHVEISEEVLALSIEEDATLAPAENEIGLALSLTKA
jgi:isoleucyl-tRNA synthetase